MTKRKAPEDLTRAPQYDLSVKERTKRGTNATMQAATARIETLRRTAVNAITNETREICSADRPLTEKMKNFVRYWAQGETILTASHKAGYGDGGSMAYRLCKDPAILKLYNAEKLAYAESCQMTRTRVMEGLLEGIEMAKLMSEPATMIAGWREVGKMCGYYEPVKKTIDINVNGNSVFTRLNKLSDAELLKLITEQPGDIIDAEFAEVVNGDEVSDGDEADE